MSSYPVIYVVDNPVRGLLDRKRSEEHLQSSNGSKNKNKNKNKNMRQIRNDKKKGTIIAQSTCQKKIEEGHSIERVWYNASRESSDTLPGSRTCTQMRSVYHAP